MFTLLTTLVSFLVAGFPKLIDYFQSLADHSHEVKMTQLQTERELLLVKEGYDALKRVEEINSDLYHVQAEAYSGDRKSLYEHDVALGRGASRWVINVRAMVRPVITYGLFLLFVFVDVFGFWYAMRTNVPFAEALDHLWDHDTQIIWASVISFWFGTQAFRAK